MYLLLQNPLSKPVRLILSFAIGLLITLSLFYVMNMMISSSDGVSSGYSDDNLIRFIRLKTETDTRHKKRIKLDKPEENKQAPVKPKVSLKNDVVKSDIKMDFPVLKSNSLSFFGSPSIGEIATQGKELADGVLVPLTRIAPQYPRKAARKKIEGWVKVEFSVLDDGTVVNINVLDAKPRRIFNRAAIRAISKWKFKPLGKQSNIEKRFNQIIEFKLNND